MIMTTLLRAALPGVLLALHMTLSWAGPEDDFRAGSKAFYSGDVVQAMALLKKSADAASTYTQYRIGNAAVRAIRADGQLMWVGTSSGLVRYVTAMGEHRFFDARDGLRTNAVLHVGKHKDKLVLGMNGGGLSLRDAQKGEWKHYGLAEGDHVLTLHFGIEGHLWIGTNKGLARFADGKFHVLGTSDGLVSNAVFAIAAPSDGTLWVGGNGGVAHIRRYALRSSP